MIPTKDHGNNPVPGKKFNRQQDNNYIAYITVDKILIQENEKVSATKEANRNIESDFYDNKMYRIESMSLQDTK